MNSATIIEELALEYLQYQKLDKDSLDFKDHIMLYERLNTKFDQAGFSYYEVSQYAETMAQAS